MGGGHDEKKGEKSSSNSVHWADDNSENGDTKQEGEKSSSSSSNNNNKSSKRDKNNRLFKDDNKVPAGSWVQHLREEDGHMFWRNNATGECTRDLWFGPRGSEGNSQHRHLVPASFAPVFVEPAPPKPSDKKNKKITQPKVLATTWFCQPWEEIFHPVTGKKHWRHRQTGDKRHTDPLF